MANDQRISEVILRLTLDKQANAQVSNGLKQAENNIKRVQTAAKQTATTAQQLSAEFAKVGRQRDIDKIAEQAIKAGRKTKDWTAELEKAAAALKKVGATESEIAGVGQSIGSAANDRAKLSSGLAFAGRELRALPAVNIPGLPVSTDAIGKITASLASLPPVALPVIGALGALGVVLALLGEQSANAARIAKASLEGRAKALELERTATSEQVKANIAVLESDAEFHRKRVEDARNTVNATRQAIIDEGGLLGNQKLGLAEIGIGNGAGQLKQAEEALAALEATLGSTTTELELNKQLLDSQAIAAHDAAEAEKVLLAARVEAIQTLIGQQTQINQLFRTGTADSVREKIAANLDEQSAIIANIAELQKLAETSEDAKKALEQASSRLHELGQQTTRLQTEVLPVIQAREDEIKAAKAQEEQLKSLASATEKFNNDVEKIQAKYDDDRLKAAEKLNDSIIKAAEAAAQAAENALAKLIERRSALAQDLERDFQSDDRKAAFERLNDQIKYQEDEAKAAREHARNLQQIKDDAAQAEEDAAFNRDFAALFDIRRNTTRQLRQATDQYTAEQQERQIAFQQKAAEQTRQDEFERQQRFIKFQQDLADATAQYQRELQLAREAKQRALIAANTAYRNELDQLQSKLVAELTARRAAAVQELQLIMQTEQQRVTIMAQAQAALVNQARALLAGVTGGSTQNGAGGGRTLPTRAFGGALMAGQAAVVNDRFPGQRESFNGTPFPPGLGVFIPSRAGQVNAGGGSGAVVNLTINAAPGQSEAQIAAIAERKIVTVLQDIYKP